MYTINFEFGVFLPLFTKTYLYKIYVKKKIARDGKNIHAMSVNKGTACQTKIYYNVLSNDVHVNESRLDKIYNTNVTVFPSHGDVTVTILLRCQPLNIFGISFNEKFKNKSLNNILNRNKATHILVL